MECGEAEAPFEGEANNVEAGLNSGFEGEGNAIGFFPPEDGFESEKTNPSEATVDIVVEPEDKVEEEEEEEEEEERTGVF